MQIGQMPDAELARSFLGEAAAAQKHTPIGTEPNALHPLLVSFQVGPFLAAAALNQLHLSRLSEVAATHGQHPPIRREVERKDPADEALQAAKLSTGVQVPDLDFA